MTASGAELTGALVACGGAALGLVVRDPRWRQVAVGVGLFGALGLIVGDVWDQARFEDLRGQPAAIGLALVLAGAAMGATAATFVRMPAVFVIAIFAVLALRIPVQVGGETNFLLVPLYGVIAGGWLRAVWLVVRGRSGELQTASSPSAADSWPLRWLCIALAASLVVYAVGVAWSEDPTNATRNVAFFLAPFAALFALLRDIRWYRKLVGQALVATVLAAFLFAVIAFWQYATRELLLNKQLKDANELHLYFRVNSIFRDPNVFGRYLAVAIAALGAWIAWRRGARETLPQFAVALVLTLALVFTFSQTSVVALVAGLGTLVWMRLGARGLAIAVATGAAALACFALLGGPPESEFDADRPDLAEAAGRSSLISGGFDMFGERPVGGWGSGSFAETFRREVDREIEKPVSHTEPVTVLAEQGIVGFIPYVATVVLGLLALALPWPSTDPIRAAIAACFVIQLVHSLGYAGFAIDPATWVLLALGVSLRE